MSKKPGAVFTELVRSEILPAKGKCPIRVDSVEKLLLNLHR
jgi:hypothetical protein